MDDTRPEVPDTPFEEDAGERRERQQEERIARLEVQVERLSEALEVRDQRLKEMHGTLLQGLGKTLHEQGRRVVLGVRYPTEIKQVPTEAEANEGTLYMRYDASSDQVVLLKETEKGLNVFEAVGVDYDYLKQWMFERGLSATMVKVNISVTR